MSTPELKPCPACGAAPKLFGTPMGGLVKCTGTDCQMFGPVRDDDGVKWNALPRRTDPQPDDRRKERLMVAANLLASMGIRDAIVNHAYNNNCAPLKGMVAGAIKATNALIAAIDRKPKKKVAK